MRMAVMGMAVVRMVVLVMVLVVGVVVPMRHQFYRHRYVFRHPNNEATANKRPVIMRHKVALAVRAQIKPLNRVADSLFQFGKSVDKRRDEHISGNAAERVEMNPKAPTIIFFRHSSSLREQCVKGKRRGGWRCYWSGAVGKVMSLGRVSEWKNVA